MKTATPRPLSSKTPVAKSRAPKAVAPKAAAPGPATRRRARAVAPPVDVLDGFHPAVAGWFRRTFPGGPTPAQVAAWPLIAAGHHTLVAAPTGSGKTLTAFLAAIDALVREGVANGGLADETTVVYVSPLKALSNDIRLNLQAPLAGIREELGRLGLPDLEIRAAVRTGDTPSRERQLMATRPPQLLVTTPESLYVLLGSASGRRMLQTVRSVIVDEIHAVADDKRGSHLSLSLERLEALAVAHHGSAPGRIGVSATQKPIETVARFLVGVDRRCEIVDIGYAKTRDLALVVPPTPLQPVMSTDQWEQVYGQIAEMVLEHRTTLIFVNTRRMAERASRHLAELLGREAVAAHHGSLSKEIRLDAEQRLKAGELRVLVATASLELGLDIGDVDLVCQLGSPRAIATFLQRAGRSGHAVGGVPKARLFPQTRDELIECTALLDCVARGELDALRVLPAPRDVLAQQLVAEVASPRVGPDPDLARLAVEGGKAGAAAAAAGDGDGDGAGDGARDGDTGLLTDLAPMDLAPRRPRRPVDDEDDGGIDVAALYAMFSRAAPYADLDRAAFDRIVRMLAEGFATQRGQTRALVQHDAVNDRLRPRRGTRLTALSSGGTIPETGDYTVMLDPEGQMIGSVNEDFAVESIPGDIFQLGNTSYRILRVEPGRVRVADADGAPPTIPFWLGEAPGRTDELSVGVARLRAEIDAKLDETGRDPVGIDAAVAWLAARPGIGEAAARQLVEYLNQARVALGVMPTRERIVFERFFDESGGMQLLIHSPFGSRINRAWGLALRKRFCRRFNFELQAAATEEGILLSLSTGHSFELGDVARYLHSASARDVLVQAVLAAPMFGARWRWNATNSLALPRMSAGRKVAPQLQRMRAEDLLASVFPDQVACAENIVGEREVPDHPLVDQTLADCLDEAMDTPGWLALLARIESGEIEVISRDLAAPSPLAAELVNARPYAFLDDAPLEERRTHAVRTRRFVDPSSPDDLGRLDADAIEAVRREAWPQARDRHELHDVLNGVVALTMDEATLGVDRAAWPDWLDDLVEAGRATRLVRDDGPSLWVATERLPLLRALLPDARPEPDQPVPEPFRSMTWTAEDALRELVRGRLGALGPVTATALAAPLGLAVSAVEQALVALQTEGFVMGGAFTSPGATGEWCERHLLARIHRYTLKRLRREIEPVEPRDFQRFLFDWQHLSDDTRVEGAEALAAVVGQLEGFEAPASTWETELLAARVTDYTSNWLDELCTSGRLTWTRLRAATVDSAAAQPTADTRTPAEKAKDAIAGKKRRRPTTRAAGGGGSLRLTPLLLLPRRQAGHWTRLAPVTEDAALSAKARRVVDYLTDHGASFFDEIVEGTRMLRSELEGALAEAVARGRIHCDSFFGLRSLLVPPSRRVVRAGSKRRREPTWSGIQDAGRWAVIRRPAGATTETDAPPAPKGRKGRPASAKAAKAAAERSARSATEEAADIEHVARTLLRRYGVVCWRLIEREAGWLPPWRVLVRVFQRLEARGEIRGGRFISGLSGEQFALPEALAELRKRRRDTSGEPQWVSVGACDPANLVGSIVAGPKLPRVPGTRIVYRDGIAVAAQTGDRLDWLVAEAEVDAARVQAVLKGVASPGRRVRSGTGIRSLPGSTAAEVDEAPAARRRPVSRYRRSSSGIGSGFGAGSGSGFGSGSGSGSGSDSD